MQQGNGVQVEHGLCTGVVAHLGVVAGEAEDVVNAEQGGAEQIGLQSHTVTVTAGELIDGEQARILQSLTGGKAAQTHNGGLVIGDVDGGDAGQIFLGFLNQMVDVESLGRADFGGNNKLASIK